MGGPKRSVLRHTSSLYHIAVMVQEVAVLCRLKHLPWPCVFLTNIGGGVHSPEVVQDWFIQSIVNYGKTQILHVFIEFRFADCVTSYRPIELLNYENGFLNLLPYVLLMFSAILNIRMISEVENFLYLSKIGGLLWYLHLVPQSIKELLSIFRHFAPKSEDKLGEADQVGALFVKNGEDMIDFGVCYINSLLFYHLLELLVV